MIHIKDIVIRAINHRDQKYNTVGNYRVVEGAHLIEVSKTKADFEFLVAVHELIELHLTQKRGVTLKEIDQFDLEFEKNRAEGNVDEPGNDPKAPYHREHVFATKIERELAEELGVDWDEYERRINALPNIPSK